MDDPLALLAVNRSVLNWHFLISYCLIFVLPLVDVVCLLPPSIIFPLTICIRALLYSAAHVVLTIMSFADIYYENAYCHPSYRQICASAHFLSGFATSELLMLASQCYHLYSLWPEFSSSIRYIYYKATFGTNLFSYKKYLSRMERDHSQELQLGAGLEFDPDVVVLFLVQTVRLAMIEFKVLLGRKLRYETHHRNMRMQNIVIQKPPLTNQRILFPIF